MFHLHNGGYNIILNPEIKAKISLYIIELIFNFRICSHYSLFVANAKHSAGIYNNVCNNYNNVYFALKRQLLMNVLRLRVVVITEYQKENLGQVLVLRTNSFVLSPND